MKRLVAAAVVALALAWPSHAAPISFEFEGETSGDPALRFAGRGYLDRQAFRYDYEQGNHPLFRSKVSIRSGDAGAVLSIIDNVEGTYFLRATQNMSGMISTFRAPWEKGIENVRVGIENLGREDSSHDFRVERVRLTVAYRILMELDGESLHADVAADADLLVAPKYRNPALPWGHQFALKTGWPDVDREVADRIAKLGFPLTQDVSVTRTIEGGDEVTERSTFRVRNLREVAFAGSGFAPPPGYRFREPTFAGPAITGEEPAIAAADEPPPAPVSEEKTAASLPIREIDPRTAPPLFVETMEVRVINVDVVVRDKRGNPVSGLTVDDFEVAEGGQKVEITNFLEISESASDMRDATEGNEGDASAPPESNRRRRIVLFVDQNSLHPQNRRTLIPAMKDFVHRAMRQGDEVMVASFRNGLRIDQQLTTNRDVVHAVIDRLVDEAPIGKSRAQRLGDAQKSFINLINQYRMIPVGPGEEPVKPDYQSGLANCRDYAHEIELEANLVIGSLEALMKALAPVGGRKLVVFATEALPTRPGVEIFHYFDGIKDEFEGGNNQSPLADSFEFNLGPKIEALADTANATGFTLYPVQAQTLSADFQSADLSGGMLAAHTQGASDANEARRANDREALLTLARLTGGTTSLASNDFSNAFAGVLDDLGNFYSLGYHVSGERSDFVRTIKVSTRNPDLVVRTRRSHVDRSIDTEMEEYVAANLFYPIERNELGITAKAGDRRAAEASGEVTLTLTIDIPTSSLTLIPRDDEMTGAFTLYIGFVRADGSVSKIARDSRTFAFPAETMSRRKSVTMALEITMDATTDRISVGILDPVSKAAGFTTAFLAPEG